ncbi:MAG: type II toxin-antitoxin system VapC family toxin [Acidobacteriota bacterium]
MNFLVLDASVAAKWFLLADEPLKDEALDLLARSADGQIGFIVPDLFWAELGNVLCKAVRQGRSTAADAEQSLRKAKSMDLPAVPSADLVEAAFGIAQKHGRSFYDAIYVALAVVHNATLVTADEKLANATAAHLPVKWLGTF